MAHPPTALVTGASRGLGRAIATSLADDGWSVIVDARHGADLIDAVAPLAGASIEALPGDIGDPDHRRDLASAAARRTGLDLLVLNAGTLGPAPLPAIATLDLSELRRTLEVNVVAQIAVVQVLLPQLRADATIVGITSDAAVEAYESWGAYGASKAALEQAMAVLAVERPDLRILRVDPGDLRTRMHQNAFPGEDISDRPLPETVVPHLRALLDGTGTSGRHRLVDALTTTEVGA